MCLLRGQLSTARKSVIISSLSQKKDNIRFAQTSLFRSRRTIFTKAENVTMGTHYQATSVAWHDAQQLLGHCCQWLLVSVDQCVWMRERVLSESMQRRK